MEYNVKKSVGDKIRNLRNEKRWSQEELAHRADLHPSHMGQIERGETGVTIDSLEKVVKALGTSFEEVFKFISPEFKDTDTETLVYIVGRLQNRSSEDLKIIANFIDTMIKWKDR